MKRKNCFLFLTLLLASGFPVFSQQPFLAITYSYSEKSKDSYSVNEDISLTGSRVIYAVKYSGRRGPDQKDKTSACTLSTDQVSKIRQAIDDKKLNVTDSLIDLSTTNKSIQVTTVITITVLKGTKANKIKVKGMPSALEGKPLYKNALSLYYQVKGMLNTCQ